MKQPGRDDKQELSVWDAGSGKALSQNLRVPSGIDLKDGSGSVHSMLLGDRIVWLVNPGNNGGSPEVIVADFEGKVSKRFEVEGRPSSGIIQERDEFSRVAVAPSGSYFAFATATSNTRMVTVYDLDTGKHAFNVKNKLMGGTPQVCFPRGRDVLFMKFGDKPIRRFDTVTGKELAELIGTDDEVTQVAESPDGKWVVSGKRYTWKTVKGEPQPYQVKVLEVRDGKTGKLVGQLNIAGAPQFFAFAGRETLIVQTTQPRGTAGVATFSRWNVADQKREWEVPGTGNGLVISPDNKRFATIGTQSIFVYNAETGEREFDPTGHSGPVEWIAFSADGKTVTTAGPGEIITWTTTGQRKQTVAVPELRRADPEFLYSNRITRGNELVWPTRTESEPKVTIFGWDREKNAIGWKFSGVPSALQVSTVDGKQVVCVRPDPKQPRDDIVTVYDGPTGKQLGEWSCPRPKAAAMAHSWPRTISGEGRFVIVGGDSPVLILDAETGKEHARIATDAAKNHPGDRPPSFAVSADGAKLAIRDRTKIEIYDTKTGKVQATHAIKENSNFMMKFSPDGKTLAMWHDSAPWLASTVLVWEFGVANALPKPLTTEPWLGTSCVAFSPDSKTLAVGYADGTSLLWDLTAK
jgi:WD40 repeat protein